MEPSEVRRRVLKDHDMLRGRIESLERLAERAVSGARVTSDALRTSATELLAALRTHMAWEDRYLAPALRDADAWGPERVAQFARDHRQQRADIEHLLESLADREEPGAFLASRLLDWIHELHADMLDEEQAFLDPRVLRDDVVGIDVETG